jgi:hypothetical protein
LTSVGKGEDGQRYFGEEDWNDPYFS